MVSPAILGPRSLAIVKTLSQPILQSRPPSALTSILKTRATCSFPFKKPSLLLITQLRQFSRTTTILQNQSKRTQQELKEEIKASLKPSNIKSQLLKQDHQTPPLQQKVQTLLKEPLHENIYTLPNILTFTRLLTAPLIGYLILQHQIWWTFSLFLYSSITDFLDGYIARKYDMKSVVGSVIDPMADKALMVICTVCLSSVGEMPLYLATTILGKDALLALSALWVRYVSLPEPKTFSRYWDFSIPSAEVRPTMISKWNTALQMVYIAGVVVKPVLLTMLSADTGALLNCGFDWFGGLVCATTILGGLSYVFTKDGFKILKNKKR